MWLFLALLRAKQSTLMPFDSRDVNHAVEVARRTCEERVFLSLSPRERGEMVMGMGVYIQEHFDEIAENICLEQGKPFFEASWEVGLSVDHFMHFGKMAESIEGMSVPCDMNSFDFTNEVPYGVSAHFLPSHYPLYIPSRSLAPALVAGNSCILKTSELSPVSSGWLAKAAQHVGIPKGVVNVLCGRREIAGHELASHQDIDHVVFIGSKLSASDVLSAVAKNSRAPAILEVGGSSSAIIFEDANVADFIMSSRTGTYINAGQVCTGICRVITHVSLYDEIIEKSMALAESLELRSGLETKEYGPYMGPLSSIKQVSSVISKIEQSIADGAECVTGGYLPKAKGNFIAPTVLKNVDKDMIIAQEEVFGPVMGIMKFEADDEAFELANSCQDSGITCNVYSQKINRIMTAAKVVDAGHIVLNGSRIGSTEIPWGGFGKSGYGLLKGREALRGYTKTKNVFLEF